jgi:hypothetical protein
MKSSSPSLKKGLERRNRKEAKRRLKRGPKRAMTASFL